MNFARFDRIDNAWGGIARDSYAWEINVVPYSMPEISDRYSLRGSVDMPLHRLSEDELRSVCRQKLETCELWLRRIIHEKFLSEYGPKYFFEGAVNGNSLFRKDIRARAKTRMADKSNRYARYVDALLLDDLIDVICKRDVFQRFFADCLQTAFPLGNEMARAVLVRLVPTRNALSHANPISVRDAEQVVCYAGDVIESLKRYYDAKNMSNEYNSPRFIRFSDSLGNSEEIVESYVGLNFDRDCDTRLVPGERLRLTVEVDASFDPTEYEIKWVLPNIGGETGSGTTFILQLTDRHVGDPFHVCARLISNRGWHRHQTHDAQIDIRYRVVPPMG